MTVCGSDKKVIRAGESVRFDVTVELPEGSGGVEKMLWDFEGTDAFLQGGSIDGTSEDGSVITISDTHVFETPGTYFPVVKIATNHRPGDIFTRIYNQARVRVIAE